ncbi:hypothetical protein C0Q61_14605 [Streptomyces albidoflavus]|nr:hypothetical protein C0Q61_14605 [Streptomyces albidoflavus]
MCEELEEAPPDLTEKLPLQRIAEGDRDAFDVLYGCTASRPAVRLQRRCADEQIVAGVMQETYLAV